MAALPPAGRAGLAGGQTQPFVLRYRLLPWLSLAAALAFLAAALLPPASPVGRGILGIGFLIPALLALAGFRTTYTVDGGRLIVRGLILRRTIVLGQLVYADAFSKRPRNAHQSRRWELRLYDQQGTLAKMNFDGSSPAGRRRLMIALEPYIMAPDVQRSGQIENAIAGVLWSPTGVPASYRRPSRRPAGISSRPAGTPGKHERH
jgi:hypothetical protein